MKKRILCVLAALAIVLAMLPESAYADEVAYTSFDTLYSDTIDAAPSADEYRYDSFKFKTNSALKAWLYLENHSQGPLYYMVQDAQVPTQEDLAGKLEIEAGEYNAVPVTTDNPGDFYLCILSEQTQAADYEFVLTEQLPKVKKPSVEAGEKSLTVSWKAVPGAKRYRINYKSGGKTKTKTVKAKVTSAKISKLKSGAKYKVNVQAVKDLPGVDTMEVSGDGVWSKLVKVN